MKSGNIRGVYGINVRTALGDRGQTELKVEPFGNVRRDTPDRPPGEDVREPLVDIHEEDDHVLVLVELPGVAKENVNLKAEDGRLTLSAKRGKTTYRKEVDLPENCSTEHDELGMQQRHSSSEVQTVGHNGFPSWAVTSQPPGSGC